MNHATGQALIRGGVIPPPVRFSSHIERIRVLEDLGPGRGGRIQIPLAVTTTLEVQRTAGGGTGTVDIDLAMFRDIAANFPKQPGPVAVHFGHLDTSTKENRKEPAAAFVERVWVEGDQLWGELSMTPQAMEKVVRQEGFRGFSIEADVDIPWPTGTIDGWGLTGGSITNTPAMDVQFAAERLTIGRQAVRFSAVFPGGTPEEESMTPEQRLKKLQAALAATTDKDAKAAIQAHIEDVQSLITANKAATDAAKKATDAAAEAAEATAETERVKAEAATGKDKPPKEITALQADVKAARDETAGLRADLTARDVKTICLGAIGEGVPPAFFAENGDTPGYDTDPNKFLTLRFGGSLDALKASAAACPKSKETAGVGSGASGAGDPNASEPHTKFDGLVVAAMKESKVDRSDAYDLVREAEPALWAEISQGYGGPAGRSSTQANG